MVDRSSLLIAVYDGIPQGGTMNTLAYAMRKGVETVILPVEGVSVPHLGGASGRCTVWMQRRFKPAAWSPAPVRGGDPGFL